jgi:hypothetical protein
VGDRGARIDPEMFEIRSWRRCRADRRRACDGVRSTVCAGVYGRPMYSPGGKLQGMPRLQRKRQFRRQAAAAVGAQRVRQAVSHQRMSAVTQQQHRPKLRYEALRIDTAAPVQLLTHV